MPIRSIKYLNQSKKKWLQTQLETEKSQTLSEKMITRIKQQKNKILKFFSDKKLINLQYYSIEI